MTSSSGLFSLSLNNGSGTSSDGFPHSFDQVFSNQNSFSVPASNYMNGSSSLTYVPGSKDERDIQIAFREPNATSWEQLPPMKFSHSGRRCCLNQ